MITNQLFSFLRKTRFQTVDTFRTPTITNQSRDVMNLSQHTNQDFLLNNWMLGEKVNFDIFQALRQRLDRVQVSSPKLAHRLCQLIPAQCPFERDITVFGHTLFHIPPMCKLNPLYDEVVALRFRALCFLADECGEDVTAYC